jgi:hypothetical protein
VERKHHDLLAWQQSVELVKSLSELDTFVVLARELGYAKETERADRQLDRVFGLVGGLINSYRKAGD